MKTVQSVLAGWFVAVVAAAQPAPATQPAPAAAAPAAYHFIDRAEFESLFARNLDRLRGRGPGRVDPAMTVEAEDRRAGYIRRLVAYDVEADDRASGWLLIPGDLKEGEKRPLMLCLHGTSNYGKDAPVDDYGDYPEPDAAEREKRSQRAHAHELVQRGFVCFAPDRPGYGRRALPGVNGSAIPKMRAYIRDFNVRRPDWDYDYGKVVHDLQQALDFLVALDCVNPDRIGAIGHSLGGHDSIKLAAIDSRVGAVVNSCGGGYRHRPDLWLDAEAMKAAVEAGDLSLFQQRNLFLQAIAPRSLLVLIGMNDTFSPVDLLPAAGMVTEYYKQRLPRYGLIRRQPFSILVHTAGHAMPDEVRDYTYNWLARQLLP